jgi:phosphate:Na+ symporter
MLFSGLGFMKDAFSPLKDSEALKNVLLTFGTYPVLGILVGIVLTILLQSSSATIALLQIMALSGLIDFQTCIPIILGDNIGTTITANIAAIGTNTASRRAARAHAIVNILGVCYMIIPVYTGTQHFQYFQCLGYLPAIDQHRRKNNGEIDASEARRGRYTT